MKSIKYIVVLVIILSIGFYFLTSDDSFKNTPLPQTNTVIKNYSEVTYLDTLVYHSLDKLEVDGIFINIIDAKPDLLFSILEGAKVDAFVYYDSKFRIYNIFVDKHLSRDKLMLIIAHESVHIAQYRNRDLINLDGTMVIYRGDTLDVSTLNYHERPWEIEAFEKQEEIYQHLIHTFY